MSAKFSKFSLKLYLVFFFRIELQDSVRRSSPEDQEIIDAERESLAAMFVHLNNLQMAAGVIEHPANEKPISDDETEYDEYDELEEPIAKPVTDITPIERKVIVLPSNGNVKTNVADLEIKFRIMEAQTQLNKLRDLIADISFQFSHVIRGQIRKKIRTRSQKRVKSLHNKLTLHARIYTRCRNYLVALNCGDSILGQFHVLKREDLKTSTVILDPNQPGSTKLKLSWIWHSGKWLLMNENALGVAEAETGDGPGPTSDPGPDSDSVTLHECK